MKGLIFDLDGTLVDSWQDVAAAFNSALESCGHSALDAQKLRPLIGCGMYQLLDDCLAEQAERGRKQMQAYYQAHLYHHAQLFSGVAQTLAELGQQGLKMTICTNKHSALALPIIAHFGLEPAMQAIVCRDTLGIAKPAGNGLLWLCDQMQLSPAQVLMVGDTDTDYQAARNAGLPIALARYGYGDCSQLTPDYWLDHFSDLTKLQF